MLACRHYCTTHCYNVKWLLFYFKYHPIIMYNHWFKNINCIIIMESTIYVCNHVCIYLPYTHLYMCIENTSCTQISIYQHNNSGSTACITAYYGGRTFSIFAKYISKGLIMFTACKHNSRILNFSCGPNPQRLLIYWCLKFVSIWYMKS